MAADVMAAIFPMKRTCDGSFRAPACRERREFHVAQINGLDR
jgi:hypothetical protein